VLHVGGAGDQHDEKRVAVEVETTQHNARQLAEKAATYREAIARGVYAGAWWYAVPGGTTEAVRRAIADSGDPDRMRVSPMPEGVTVYR
jgi:hypothetical protein